MNANTEKGKASFAQVKPMNWSMLITKRRRQLFQSHMEHSFRCKPSLNGFQETIHSRTSVLVNSSQRRIVLLEKSK